MSAYGPGDVQLGAGVPGFKFGEVSEPAEVPLGHEHWNMNKTNPGWYHGDPYAPSPAGGFPDQYQGAPAPAEATEHSQFIDAVNQHIAQMHLARAIRGILEEPRGTSPQYPTREEPLWGPPVPGAGSSTEYPTREEPLWGPPMPREEPLWGPPMPREEPLW